MNELERKIEDMANKGKDLRPLQKDLTTKLKTLDKFFDKFLDDFNGRLSLEHTDRPEWQLYKSKLKEYETYDEALDLIKFYLQKEAI